MRRASNILYQAYRPSHSTMPIYDPKGTHWARYTTCAPCNDPMNECLFVVLYVFISLLLYL